MEPIPDFAAGGAVTPRSFCRWEDPQVWGGVKPGRDDTVVIPAGVEVLYSGYNEEPIKALIVRGRLTFEEDEHSLLKVGTLVAEGDGEIRIGSRERRVLGSVEIVFTSTPLDRVRDPRQYGGGLILRENGRLFAYGQSKDASCRITQDALVNASAFMVDGLPQGWMPGDRVALPPSGGKSLHWIKRVPEVRAVTSTIGDSVVVLDRALAESHLAARDADGEADCFPDVVNLERNVVFRSEDPAGVRGHFIATDHAYFEIDACAFRHMGRTTDAPLDNTTFSTDGAVTKHGTNQVGRYAVHVHQLHGPPPPGRPYRSMLVNCVVEGSLKWAVAIHGTCCLAVHDNVVYDFYSAGIVTEDGTEAYNEIVRNVVVYARRGDAFRFNGNRNWVEENTAACCFAPAAPAAVQGVGYSGVGAGFYFPPTPRVWQRIDTFKPDGTPDWFYRGRASCLSFKNNRAYGCSTGVWFDHTRGEHYVDGFTCWFGYGFVEDGRAAVAYDTDGVTFDNLVARGCSVDHQANVRTTLLYSDIQGCQVGVRDGALNGRLVVEGCYLRNTCNAQVVLSPSAGAGPFPAGPIKEALFSHTLFRKMPGQSTPRHIELSASYFGSRSRVPVLGNVVRVVGFDGDSLDSFRVYFREQAPDVVVPYEGDIPNDPVVVKKACPEKGLTNAEAMAKYGLAWAGSVAPATAAVREGFVGLVAQGA